MKIAIDAGHGYNTAGKRIPDGSMREWEFNDSVVRKIISGLSEYEDVLFLRLDDPTGKTDVPLKERSNKANAWKADVCYSQHANGYGEGGFNSVEGIETFIYTSRPNAAFILASSVQNHMLRETGRKNRGVKAANLHMVREPKMTAILSEAGFMTHKEEAELLKSEAYRQKVANATIKAFVEVYKLKSKPAPVAAPKPVAPKPAAAPKKEESVQILTGGLSPAMVEEVSEYFKSKGWWAQVQFTTDGKNPRALSGGLDPKMRTEYEAWLKERKWYYVVKPK